MSTAKLREIWKQLYLTKKGTAEEHAAYHAYVQSTQGIKTSTPSKRRIKK